MKAGRMPAVKVFLGVGRRGRGARKGVWGVAAVTKEDVERQQGEMKELSKPLALHVCSYCKCCARFE